MITDPGETSDAVVNVVANSPDRVFTAHGLAGELVALEKHVKAALENLVETGLLVKDGETYRRAGPETFVGYLSWLVETPLTLEEKGELFAASQEVAVHSVEELAHALLVAKRWKKGGGP